MAARALEVLQGRRPSLKIGDAVYPKSGRRLVQVTKPASVSTQDRECGPTTDGHHEATASSRASDESASASTNAAASSSTDGMNSASADDGGVCIYVNETAMRPVPSSALAVAVVCADVIVPPSRYTPHFDWFYDRIEGHESEYERIAAAHTFATYPPPPSCP